MEERMNNSIFTKVIVIGALVFISWIASILVLNLVQERSYTADEAALEVGDSWGKEQTLSGPVLSIPILSEKETRSTLNIAPKALSYEIDMVTQTLERGIFEVPVYTAVVKAIGEIDGSVLKGHSLDVKNAQLSIGLPDTRGITTDASLRWLGQEYGFESGNQIPELGVGGIHAPVLVSKAGEQYPFEIEFQIKGSNSFDIVPFGGDVSVSVNSDWSAPSFKGGFLPTDRVLKDDGFNASWEISSFGSSLPEHWISHNGSSNQAVMNATYNANFGVELHEQVGLYKQVERSVKYAILFIMLTFLAFFMFEVLGGLRIHPINYLLVGFSLALFYLLLLSFSEHIGFLSAYIVSTIAITGLITLYSKSVLKAKGKAAIIALMLLGLYSYLYVLLQLEELSLILGSVFLFVVLSLVMYLTRNIDWYELKK